MTKKDESMPKGDRWGIEGGEAIQLSKNDVVDSAKRQARSNVFRRFDGGDYTTEMGKFKPKSRRFGGAAEVLGGPGVKWI